MDAMAQSGHSNLLVCCKIRCQAQTLQALLWPDTRCKYFMYLYSEVRKQALVLLLALGDLDELPMRLLHNVVH